MAEREKVIEALEYLISGDCTDTPLDYMDEVEMAIKLLKEQEPRVLTLTELWHMEHKPVYIQRKNSRLYVVEPAIVLKTERCYIPSLGDSYIFMRENKIHDKYWTCDYNVTWRCWTSRPTDEQREATPWEPPKEGGTWIN